MSQAPKTAIFPTMPPNNILNNQMHSEQYKNETSQLFPAVFLKHFPCHNDPLFHVSTVLSFTQHSESPHSLTPTKLKSVSTVITDHSCMMGVTAAWMLHKSHPAPLFVVMCG